MTIEGQDIKAARTTKGQDIKAARTTEGQDIKAARTTEGQDIKAAMTTKGQDIKAARTTEGQDMKAARHLLHEPSGFNQSLIFTIWMRVMDHKGARMHRKAEPHVQHGLNVHHLVFQVARESLIIPGHQLL